LFGVLKPRVCELLADDVVLEDVELPDIMADMELVDLDVLEDCDRLSVDEVAEVEPELEDDVDDVTIVEEEPEEDWLLEDVELVTLLLVTELDEVDEDEEDEPEEVDVDPEVDVAVLVSEVLDSGMLVLDEEELDVVKKYDGT